MQEDPIAAALTLLKRGRADLAKRLTEVDAAIARLEGQDDDVKFIDDFTARPPVIRSGNSQRDRVLDVMAPGQDYTAEEIIQKTGENEASIRSVLSRLVK